MDLSLLTALVSSDKSSLPFDLFSVGVSTLLRGTLRSISWLTCVKALHVTQCCGSTAYYVMED